MLILIQVLFDTNSKKWATTVTQWQGKRNPWKSGHSAFGPLQMPDDLAFFCQWLKYLEDRLHEFPNQTQFQTLEKRWKTKNREQPNYDSRIHYNCGVNFFSSFEVKLNSKKIEIKPAISTDHWLDLLTGIIQMPPTMFFFSKKSSWLHRNIMWSASTETLK